MQILSRPEPKEDYKFIQDSFGIQDNLVDFLKPVGMEEILKTLAASRKQIEEGKCQDMEEALEKLGKKYGFL